MTRRTETGVMMMTTGKAFVLTWKGASLHGRSMAKDATETTVTYMMSSAPEMQTAEFKANSETGSMKIKNNTMKETDYYGPYYGQPHSERSPEVGHIPGSVKTYSLDLKRVRWPVTFKLSGIKKYDRSTNPSEWLEVYQLTIKAPRGDSYVMANYLLVCLSSSARTWLLGLPMGSVRSWNHLCRLFNSNFHATCVRPRVS
jgi:hypothetical protein